MNKVFTAQNKYRSFLDPIDTEKAITVDAQNVIQRPFDLRNHLPKIATYSMAPGLTYDSVFLPMLTKDSFSSIPSSRRHGLLFSGITRASRWVYLSTVKGMEFEEMSSLLSAQVDGHLRVVHKEGFV